MSMKKRLCLLLCAVLLCAAFFCAGYLLGRPSFPVISFLQSPSALYQLQSGILLHNLPFASGEPHTFVYDFADTRLATLRTAYVPADIAAQQDAWAQSLALMHEYAPRLTHRSDYDNTLPCEAQILLAYALDTPAQGINCRAKAQILNELCLSLGIPARKVWLMPHSPYDSECHVVNEIWDDQREKWIMLDISNNLYWVDANSEPLSVLEIRTHLAEQTFCTPVGAHDDLRDLSAVRDARFAQVLYLAKNMAYLQYFLTYGVGEADCAYTLCPQHADPTRLPIVPHRLLDLSCVTAAPQPCCTP